MRLAVVAGHAVSPPLIHVCLPLVTDTRYGVEAEIQRLISNPLGGCLCADEARWLALQLAVCRGAVDPKRVQVTQGGSTFKMDERGRVFGLDPRLFALPADLAADLAAARMDLGSDHAAP